ncbi:hypothetical protein A33M_2333 [Rhodovulum sp. PH10]|uniref:hypothetical protein n=1 Tax=Rhodovulum sp. PH10 TaxID=1187851 RepID=UPI00027C2A0C|nr:hypothetical protein [Rhodovulum sp. PH10]EJW12210.1 hypothetical protein A33M_2333 [Rhodovulum sp. PH10]
MVFAFDTLGYSKRLREAGIPGEQAEAHAEAARDFIMVELVTKTDLAAALSALEGRLEAKIREGDAALAGRIDGLESRLEAKIREGDAALEAKIERLSLQLTVRLGALMVAGIGALALIQRLN